MITPEKLYIDILKKAVKLNDYLLVHHLIYSNFTVNTKDGTISYYLSREMLPCILTDKIFAILREEWGQ